MGGKALKNTKTRRFPRSEYEPLASFVLESIRSLFPNARASIIRCYRNKEDFGDLDVIVESSKLPNDYVQTLTDFFKPNECVRNGSCFSLDVKELQVDLILMPTKDYEIAEIYFSYNDLGNLMGRVADKIGFKYGHRGLLYRLYDGNYEVGEITVSQTPDEIFAFLGFDYARYLKGFDTREEIFEFVLASKYFTPELFLLENRNNKGRNRDGKRPTYAKFLEYIQGKETGYIFKEKELYVVEAENFFPNFKAERETLLKLAEEARALKAKFNGKIVMDETGLMGDKLGNFINEFKKNFADFDSFVRDSSSEEIVLAIRSFTQSRK